MILQAKDYSNRENLETYISTLSGLTAEPKTHEISGTDEELARLNLSESSIVWGIKCVSTTKKVKQPPQLKPNRGEIFESGINLPADKKGKIKNV